jgi:hypothetical protein
MRALRIPAGFAALLMASAAIPSCAFAQSVGGELNGAEAETNFARDRNTAVRERPHPEYEAAGVRMGAFMAFPRIEADVEYDDNIFALPNNKVSDTIWRLKPEVSIQSNWSRHQLRLNAGLATDGYANHSGENTTDWNVGADGRLDFAGRANVSGGLSFSRLTEPRTSSNQAVGGGFGVGSPAKPIQYDQTLANIGWTKEFNRLKLGIRGDWSNYDYHDVAAIGGGTIDEDLRDRNITAVTARADYAISPATAVFIEASANNRHFRVTPPPPQLKQDSSGYEVLAGVNFEAGHLARGDIGVGYLQQNYKAAGAKDASGFGARGKLEWFPTQLTTVTARVSRSVEDSGVVNLVGQTGGYLYTDTGLQVDHELRRNIILTGSASYTVSDYQQIDRRDNRWLWAASVTYLMNRRVGLNAGFSSLHQDSHGTALPALLGNKFTDNKLGASLIFQW